MATSTIFNTTKDPAGDPVPGVPVVASLLAPGFRVDDNTEIARVVRTASDSNGFWELILEETENITPENNFYVIEERYPERLGGPVVWLVSVGAGDSSLAASQVAYPENLDPSYLTTVIGDARYATLGGANTFSQSLEVRPIGSPLSHVFFPFRALFEPGPSQYYDEVLMFGTNLVDSAGTPDDATQGQVWWQFESKFRNPVGPGPWLTEAHLNMKPPGAASGSQQRPLNVAQDQATGTLYIEADGQWELWDSARTSQRAVFDFNGANRAMRLVNSTILWSTAAADVGTGSLIIVEKTPGATADQVFRVQGHGVVTVGPVFGQDGGASGAAIVQANATAVPSTNPVGAVVRYVQAGVPKTRTPTGQVLTEVAVAVGPKVLDSPLVWGQDAGVAGNGNTMYVRFTVEKEQVVNRVLFFVGNSAGNVQAGIYASTGASPGVPGDQLATSGTVACPAAGGASVTVPATTLQPGTYFAALTLSDGAATIRYRSGLGPAQALAPIYYLDASAFPLNGTANPTPVAGENVFLVQPAYV